MSLFVQKDEETEELNENQEELTTLMASVDKRLSGVNPEVRPFARGVVLERIENGDKDAYLSKRTRRERKRLRKILVITMCGLLAAVILLAAYLVYQNERTIEQAQNRFEQAVSLVQDTDDEVIGIDTEVNSQVSEDKLDDLQALIDAVPDTQTTLQDVLDILDEVEPVMKKQSNGEIASNLRASAKARMTMLDEGSTLVRYDINAMKATDEFSDAWTLIVDVDTATREATSLVAVATTDNVTKALTINNDSLTKLEQAQVDISQATEYLPEADFSTVSAYLNAKVEAVGYARDSDQAFLNGDTATSTDMTAKYNTADASVVTCASKLPADPSQIILNAYDKATASPRKQYVEARQQAAEADTAVRNYLGINEVIVNDTSSQTAG